MDRTSGAGRPLIGALVGTVFGVVFFVANAGVFGLPWSVLLRVVGIAIGIVLAVRILRLRRRTAVSRAELGFGRGYWLIVVAEIVVLAAGVLVGNRVLHRPELGVAWIAVVVGVHFLALGRLWRVRVQLLLGVVLVVLGLVGFLLAATTGSAAAVVAVAGIGSGLALFGTASTVLLR